MNNIITTIKNLFIKYKKGIIISGIAIVFIGTISGILIYNNINQNNKEKELLAQIDNLKEILNDKDESLIKNDSDIYTDDNKETATNDKESNFTENISNNSNNNISNSNNGNLEENVNNAGNSSVGNNKNSTGEQSSYSGVGSSFESGTSETTTKESFNGQTDDPNYFYTKKIKIKFADIRSNYTASSDDFCNYEINKYSCSYLGSGWDDISLNINTYKNVEGTLSVTVKCTSDEPNVMVKYIVKGSKGNVITNGEYETMSAQSPGNGNTCTVKNTVYFPFIEDTYTIEFIE